MPAVACHRSCKPQYWCGFPAILLLEAAPMLENGNFGRGRHQVSRRRMGLQA